MNTHTHHAVWFGDELTLCCDFLSSFFFPHSYGFVEFEDNRDADDAVYELNGKELCGERVIVEHARGPRRDRDGYGGGYWGGGRSKCSLLQDTLSSPSPWGEVSMWTAQRAVCCYILALISRLVA